MHGLGMKYAFGDRLAVVVVSVLICATARDSDCLAAFRMAADEPDGKLRKGAVDICQVNPRYVVIGGFHDERVVGWGKPFGARKSAVQAREDGSVVEDLRDRAALGRALMRTNPLTVC